MRLISATLKAGYLKGWSHISFSFWCANAKPITPSLQPHTYLLNPPFPRQSCFSCLYLLPVPPLPPSLFSPSFVVTLFVTFGVLSVCACHLALDRYGATTIYESHLTYLPDLFLTHARAHARRHADFSLSDPPLDVVRFPPRLSTRRKNGLNARYVKADYGFWRARPGSLILFLLRKDRVGARSSVLLCLFVLTLLQLTQLMPCNKALVKGCYQAEQGSQNSTGNASKNIYEFMMQR